MRTPLTTSLHPMLATLLCATLAACGGGNSETPSLPPASLVTMGAPTLTGTVVMPAESSAATQSGTVQGGTTLSAGTAVLTAGAAPAPSSTVSFPNITSVQLTSTASVPQINTPVTFGQVFAQGDVRNSDKLAGKTATGANVPLQVDVKTRHPDGSLRHAVITAMLPTSMPQQVQTVYLVKGTSTTSATSTGATAPTQLLNAGFNATFNANIGGTVYSASADALLKSGNYTMWLAGPLANEWLVSAPLKTASGVVHPHLTARFAIRAYPGANSARVDVTIENTWAFEAAPQNFTYDAQLLVGGKEVYNKLALTHYHHARWRKMFWWGTTPQLDVRHNAAYMVASKALPNYDMSLSVKETTLDTWDKNWKASKAGPMEAGIGQPYMPSTGGRIDLGLLPRWNALYLVSMDQRLKNVALGMSDLAGSWSAHFRNKITGKPVTLADYPYMTILGNPGDTLNPATKLREAFPLCPTTVCATPYFADTSHQPAFSYLPYLVTGDFYHLEELQFWANYSAFSSNPWYREYGKGLFKPDQVRGQGWSLRTVAQAAYITPDSDPQKAVFTDIVNNNLDWYNANYTNSPTANKLGAITLGTAIGYDNNTGIAPWMDDFVTAAVGMAAELGFSRAEPFLAWKAKFPVERMTGDGYCWIKGSVYALKIRDSSTSPLYETIGEAYRKTNTAEFNLLGCNTTAMATSLGLKLGEMIGYSTEGQGYPSYMQPALAYSVGAHPGGAAAWKQFMSRTVKPDYSMGPEFDILPR
jgi:hypothetical protein